MNFGLTDEQREIQSTAREFLADRFKPDVARIVEPGAATIEPLDLVDTTRRYFRVSAEGGESVDAGDVHAAADRAVVALAAELVGVAQRALEMAVAYAKEREQFGRPIGA